MPARASHSQTGFSMIELLIALSIFFLVLGGLFQIFGPSNVMYLAGQRKLDAQQSARVVMDMIVRQLRMAGYYPENFDANAGNDIAAGNRNAIQIATNTGLVIFGAATDCLDANADGMCDPDQTLAGARSQIFLFCLNGTELLTKTGPAGAAASYTCNADNPGQQVLGNNITGLTFTYFDVDNMVLAGPLDGQNLGVAPDFAVTTQRDAVRSVAITLTAQENVPGQSAQIYTLTSNVRLRNPN